MCKYILCLLLTVVTVFLVTHSEPTVINAGIGGDASQDILARLPSLPAEIVILLVGTNDAFNSSKIVPASRFQSNLTAIVKWYQDRHTPVVLLTLPPVVDRFVKQRHDFRPYYGEPKMFQCNDIIRSFNASIRQVGTEQNVPVIDIYEIFVSHGEPLESAQSWIRNGNNAGTEDGIHLTSEGYKTLARCVLPQVQGYHRILCLWDSITQGVHVSAHESYPAQLQIMLVNPVRRTVGENTSTGSTLLSI